MSFCYGVGFISHLWSLTTFGANNNCSVSPDNIKENIARIAKAALHKLPGKKVLMSSLSVLSVVVCAVCRGCPVCPDDHEFMINMSDSLTRGCKSDDVMKKNIFLTIEIFHPCADRPSESQTQR